MENFAQLPKPDDGARSSNVIYGWEAIAGDSWATADSHGKSGRNHKNSGDGPQILLRLPSPSDVQYGNPKKSM